MTTTRVVCVPVHLCDLMGKCSVINCANSLFNLSNGRRFFQVPNFGNCKLSPKLIQKRQERWLARLNRVSFTYGDLVCSDHFVSGEPSGYDNEDNVDWAPSINLGPAQTAIFQLPENPVKEYVKTLPDLEQSRKGDKDCEAKEPEAQGGTSGKTIFFVLEKTDSPHPIVNDCPEKRPPPPLEFHEDSQIPIRISDHHKALNLEYSNLKNKYDSLQNKYQNACHSVCNLKEDLKRSEAGKQLIVNDCPEKRPPLEFHEDSQILITISDDEASNLEYSDLEDKYDSLQNKYQSACLSICSLEEDLKRSEAGKQVLERKLEAATKLANEKSEEMKMVTEIVNVKTDEILKLKEEFEKNLREEYENELLLQLSAVAHIYEDKERKLLREIHCLRGKKHIFPQKSDHNSSTSSLSSCQKTDLGKGSDHQDQDELESIFIDHCYTQKQVHKT